MAAAVCLAALPDLAAAQERGAIDATYVTDVIGDLNGRARHRAVWLGRADVTADPCGAATFPAA